MGPWFHVLPVILGNPTQKLTLYCSTGIISLSPILCMGSIVKLDGRKYCTQPEVDHGQFQLVIASVDKRVAITITIKVTILSASIRVSQQQQPKASQTGGCQGFPPRRICSPRVSRWNSDGWTRSTPSTLRQDQYQ